MKLGKPNTYYLCREKEGGVQIAHTFQTAIKLIVCTIHLHRCTTFNIHVSPISFEKIIIHVKFNVKMISNMMNDTDSPVTRFF